MLTDNNIWLLAEGYVAGTLTPQQAAVLDEKKATDQAFTNEFNECVNLLRSMNGAGKQAQFRGMLKDVHAKQVAVKRTRFISVNKHYLRTAAMAAGIALLTSVSTFWVMQNNSKKMASQYSLLRRDLEKYQRSHNQLVNNIQQQQSTTTPAAEVRYTGTGFALSNDGYLVTNYHVTEGADSVYIQSRDGQYHKAYTVGYDQNADIAILKVEAKNFKFGKSELPYTFASNKRKLGARIYSLGFPQDEIVYNEGYISSKNGYEGDSAQYRLQIPAYPGQSGAPVIDESGNVVAMITGRDDANEGTTYAVSSKALMKLLRTLPKENTVKLPKTNKLANMTLEQQIEKLEYYTYSVKVYKR